MATVKVLKPFTLKRNGGQSVQYQSGIQEIPDSDLHYSWTKHHITHDFENVIEPTITDTIEIKDVTNEVTPITTKRTKKTVSN